MPEGVDGPLPVSIIKMEKVMLRRCLKSTFGLITALAAVSVSNAALAQQATLERIKRMGEVKVCLDQNNLPYSSDKLDPPGFDVEFAQEIAKDLGLKLTYFWYATNVGKRALRQLHTEGNCDFFPGLPHEESFEEGNFKLILTKPYYVGGFATLARADAPATILADTKAKGIGVQMGTLADFKLFDKGFERKLHKSTEEIFDSISHNEIDAAVVPMPEGAWLTKLNSSAKLKVLGNTEKEFLFPMAIGVRKADKDLRDVLNGIIDKIESDGRAQKIFEKYGMVKLTSADAAPAPAPKDTATPPEKKSEATPPAETPKAPEPAAPAPAASDKKSEAAPAPAAPAVAAAPSQGGHELVEPAVPSTDPEFPNDSVTLDKGRKMYKQACYKCHGPNVVSGGTLPDLRLYEGDNYEMFAVIQAGRLEKGMPKWGDYLSIDEIKQVVVYVKDITVKTKHELDEHSNRHH